MGHKTQYSNLEPFRATRTTPEIQHAAKRIAEFIGLNDYVFFVSRVKLEGKAAYIELKQDGKDVFIAVSDRLVSASEHSVLATLAHEICHKYLHHHRLDIREVIRSYENEVLTDICTVYLGLGKLMLNGCQYETIYHDNESTNTTIVNIGYLSKRQLAAVYNLVCSMRNIGQEEAERNLSHDALSAVRSVASKYRNVYYNTFSDFDFAHQLLMKLRGYVDQVQTSLIETNVLIEQIQNRIIQPAELFIKQTHDKLFEILKSNSREPEIEYDPALRYLQNIHRNMELVPVFDDLERLLSASRYEYELLIKLVNNHPWLTDWEASDERLIFQENIQCPIDNTLIEIPSPISEQRIKCPSCGYVLCLSAYKPKESTYKMSPKQKVKHSRSWLRRVFKSYR